MITYLDKVAVRQTGENISITRFSVNDMQKYGYSDEDLFIAWYMELRFPGEAFTVIDETNIPKDQNGNWDKAQRKEWSLINGKVEVDPVKVKKKNEKLQNRQAVLAKLKISETELADLLKR